MRLTYPLAIFLLSGVANAQLVDEFNPPRANCCLAVSAKSLADQLQDWNQIGRYHQADQELMRQPPDPKRVVFMGDSITDFWKLDEYFPGKPYVNRGISGQTTPQMLARMYPDVIELHPAAMIVLAGINDVSRNTGPATAEMVEQNIMAMTELAQHHGIKVILCSLLPVSDYPFVRRQSQPVAERGPFPLIKMSETHPPADILRLNAWMKDYAARVNAIYADYYSALLDEKGALKDALSADGLHPNAEGYKVMAPIAAAAIDKAEAAVADNRVVIDPNGTVHVPAQSVPLSNFLSPEAKAYVTQHLQDMQHPERIAQDNGVPRFMKGYLDRQIALYPVNREDTQVAGVHAYVYTPKAGIAPANRNRVLIDLHGGGFSGCWPACAELESIPIAALAKIRVISLDYREAPKDKFPAASEDVAAVYKELLKDHAPENVGIYGCSAGGMLTAMSVAWFEKHSLPMPGAIGIFCSGAGSPSGAGFGGDAAYTAGPLGEARIMAPAPQSGGGLGYLAGTDPKDPLVAPINSPQILAKFPPTLIITATRGFELSGALYTHTQLVKLGVDAELHVWDGLFHGFFYNPDVPESRECYDVIVKFFDRHLGKAKPS